VADLEQRIDELYELPLAEFTAARNALAKTLSGPEAARVRKLAKPPLVAWAINQLYWGARPIYERLLESGEAVRAAQIAALKGRRSDLRGKAEAHRNAVAAAVQKASELAANAGSHPSPDALARTLEAISLAPNHPEPPGRLTTLVQPAGFEALAGITPTAAARADRVETHSKHEQPRPPREQPRGEPVSAEQLKRAERTERRDQQRRAREEQQRARAEAARSRQAAAALKIAERALDRARAVESRASRSLDVARKKVEEAERRVAAARAGL
jgi:hypothetical protein